MIWGTAIIKNGEFKQWDEIDMNSNPMRCSTALDFKPKWKVAKDGTIILTLKPFILK